MELAVVMGISSTVSAAMYYTFAVQSWTSNRENANSMSQNQARQAIERMVREIQLAGYDPTDANTANANRFGFQTIDAQTIRFTTDTNKNGVVDGATENRGFTLSNGTVYATSQGSMTSALASGVQALSFTYLDVFGNTTSTAADVREVKITATLVSRGRAPQLAASAHTLVGYSFTRNPA
jgi:type II secretory pathway component PulJ